MILQRVSVSEQIFDDIVDKIRRREIVQGQKLVIKNLEHEYGVSSTPVRDALYMLKTAGFLEMKSSGTARVITMEYDDCLELVRINLGLVRLSFFLIMENGMAPKLLSGMEPLYEKQVELKDAEPEKRIRAYIDFVNYPGAHTGNKFYLGMTGTLWGKSVVAFGDYTEVYDPDEAFENSRQMMEALKDEDYERFQSLRFYMIEAFGRYLERKHKGAGTSENAER